MDRAALIEKAKAAADRLLQAKGYISTVDVLLELGRLSPENHKRWRARQIPYLESVILGNLSQHAVLCRELSLYAKKERKLKPSHTVYLSWGKGRKQKLQFSKSGDSRMEELYSTHYVSPRLATAKKARQQKPEPPNAPAPSDPAPSEPTPSTDTSPSTT